MENVFKARVVRIGNSRGVRIPKVWLEQLKFGEEVEMAVAPGRLTIRPALGPREGWSVAFEAMAARREDKFADAKAATKWDAEEWEW